MNKRHTRKLFKDFPEFWKYAGDPRQSLITFGFECGDGWFDVIYELCSKIKEHLGTVPDGWYVLQVKEKYAGLIYYTSWVDDEVNRLIDEAEGKSFKTCETCGSEGKMMERHGWYKTVCPKHAEEFGYEDLEDD